MDEETRDKDLSDEKVKPRASSRRTMLALAVTLVVIVALAIGLNVGGLREKLLWRISPARIESLAILPFENLSHDPEQDCFADGMTAGLTDNLAQIGTFRVIARTSVVKYKRAPHPLPEIARELHVESVVEGSVLRSGDRVQLTVTLTHAATNRRLWGQKYERDLGNVRNLQGEISRAVALGIKAKLTPEQEARLSAVHAVNPQAYEAYLRGAYGRDSAKAEAYLKQAIELDPAYAPPYVELASNYYWSNYFTALAPRDTYPKAKEAAQKALSIDPTLAGAHYYLALVAQEYNWNFVEAEKEFKRAVELNPNEADIRHLYSHFLLCMGRDEESRAEDRVSEEIDPVDSGLVACLSWHSVATGNYDEAEKRAQRALSMGAGVYPRLFLGWSYEQRSLFNEAILELQKVVAGWGGEVFPTAALGHAYAAAGREREAREVLDRLLERSKKEYVSAYEIATVYAGLRDRDRAFEWLEKAYQERSNALARFRMDPRLRGLQSDPRFKELLGRMNFPQKP
jgi:TolB-like protein/Tfp pilus assembly protein PilF